MTKDRSASPVLKNALLSCLLVILAPSGCLTIALMLAIGGSCLLLVPPEQRAPMPADLIPVPAPGGGLIQLNRPYQRCTVLAVGLEWQNTQYDTDGRPTHVYRVSLDTYNHTAVPKGPRLRVTLWDRSLEHYSTSLVASSVRGDLMPGHRKTFTGLLYDVSFTPSAVQITEE